MSPTTGATCNLLSSSSCGKYWSSMGICKSARAFSNSFLYTGSSAPVVIHIFTVFAASGAEAVLVAAVSEEPPANTGAAIAMESKPTAKSFLIFFLSLMLCSVSLTLPYGRCVPLIHHAGEATATWRSAHPRRKTRSPATRSPSSRPAHGNAWRLRTGPTGRIRRASTRQPHR